MKIEIWSRLPAAVRDHLAERMHDRNISLEDLNQLRLWMESKPDVPDAACTRILARSSFAGKANTKDIPFAGPTRERTKTLKPVSSVSLW